MYYMRLNEVMIVMLGGGDKSSQVGDIAAAKALAGTIEE
jgi:putative component of toxin-antitoxin plasmid stabilization module